MIVNSIPLLVHAGGRFPQDMIDLRKERDIALVSIECLHASIAAVTRCYEAKVSDLKLAYSEIAYLNQCIRHLPSPKSVAEMINKKDAEITLLRQALAMKDARIAELKTRLASTPVAFEDAEASPAPVPGFLRAIRTGNKAAGGLIGGPGDKP